MTDGGPPPRPFARTSTAAARVISVGVGLIGVAVLAGWLLDLPGLTSLYLPGPTVKANAALCLICLSIANLLLIAGQRSPVRRRLGRVVAVIPAVIGALTFAEHVTGWSFGIDQLIAAEPAGAQATMSPNRMGPPAAIVNMLLGVALLLGSSAAPRRRALAQLLGFGASLIAVLPLIGFAYGFSELYAVARYTGISMANATALLLLGLAVQAGRPERGLAALLCREDEAGLFARRLLPAAVALPFVSGWLVARSLGAGLVDAPFAISVMVLVLMIVLAWVIWRTGAHLVRSLDARAASQRELAERARIARQEDQQKTQFLATLSHELRNPLAPIRFAVALLDGPPASAERARKTIARQVHHLTALIDDLLDLTRISRDKLELHKRPCELQQLVRDAIDAVADEINQAGHQLLVDLPAPPIGIHADPDRVVQILVNLLTNATRYTPPHGQITVTTAIDGSHVMIGVRDSGEGIEAADLQRVFERFVQVGSSRHGGLGIGLALVKALAEQHGGSVDAYSDGPGRGAEFRVRLPQAAGPVLSAPAVTAGAAASCRILVVDDNRDAADMLGRLLVASGHQVMVVYDGETAMRRPAAFTPQIGFLDIGMPGMDGYRLAAQLRAGAQSAPLFLVAITGWGQDADRCAPDEAGGSAPDCHAPGGEVSAGVSDDDAAGHDPRLT